MLQKIKNYIDSKPEDYILDVISKVLLALWVFAALMIFIGGFIFGSVGSVVGGLCLGFLCTGWDRVMAYLTWRE